MSLSKVDNLSFFFVYPREDSVVFWIRVNGKIDDKNRVEVPKTEFASPVVNPDFSDMEIIDDGLKVRFGKYECMVETIYNYLA